jgi:hypothetical protein
MTVDDDVLDMGPLLADASLYRASIKTYTSLFDRSTVYARECGLPRYHSSACRRNASPLSSPRHLITRVEVVLAVRGIFLFFSDQG